MTPYIVTARHIVQGVNSVIVRTNSVSGEIAKIPVEKTSWWHSGNPAADVAIAVFERQPDVSLTLVREEQIIDDEFVTLRTSGQGTR